MSKQLKIQILERARALIEDERRWCRGELAMDADANAVCPMDDRAERHCALGALIAIAYGMTHDAMRARDLALTAFRPHHGAATLVNVNDVRGHAAVLALFDAAMARGADVA
jgi:hypothetical protein